MNTYQIDTLVQLSTTFYAADGVTLVDPTDVVLFVRPPDQIRTEYTGGQITKVSTGVYMMQITTTQSGQWSYKWQGSGTVVITSEDQFFKVAKSTLIPG